MSDILLYDDDDEQPSQPAKGSTGLCAVTCLLLGAALYLMFWRQPAQSPAALTQRMVYVYVPAVWVSGAALVLLMLNCVGYVFTSQTVWYSRALASAEAGVLFGSVTAISSVLRAKILLNRWQALTLVSAIMLVVWALAMVFVSLRRYAETPAARKWLAAFGVVACMGVPGVYKVLKPLFPPQTFEAVLRHYADAGFNVVLTLLTSMAAFFCLFWYLVQHRVSIDMMEEDLEALRVKFFDQTWKSHQVRVENQDFIIEGYNFTEYQHDE